MKQFTDNTPFKPQDLGVAESWSVVIDGASGNTTIQVQTPSGWLDVRTFDESGTFTENLPRFQRYRFSEINANAVWVF